MPSPFDSLAKDLLEVLLADLGVVEREHEVPSLPAQRADVFFAPDPGAREARAELGVVGMMVEEACLLEPFHDAPSTAEVVSCARKLLNHMHARFGSATGDCREGAPSTGRWYKPCWQRPGTARACWRR